GHEVARRIAAQHEHLEAFVAVAHHHHGGGGANDHRCRVERGHGDRPGRGGGWLCVSVVISVAEVSHTWVRPKRATRGEPMRAPPATREATRERTTMRIGGVNSARPVAVVTNPGTTN